MKILLATPAAPSTRTGNGSTAHRWASLLRSLGHDVCIGDNDTQGDADLLIALHAHKCARAVRRFRKNFEGRPIVVGLAGTDLYGDLSRSRDSLCAADRIVLLQPCGLRELPRPLRDRSRVIYQSATPPRVRTPPLRRHFEILVVANLRSVKDPLRPALAVRRLPDGSKLRVTHVGHPISESLHVRAQTESERNARYDYRGSVARARVRRLLTRARALCVPSRSEGGANVVSEALAARTPILCSDIPGNLGILGAGFEGAFRQGDTQELRELLCRFEADHGFRRRVAAHCRELAPLVRPAREREAWRQLLAEVFADTDRPA